MNPPGVRAARHSSVNGLLLEWPGQNKNEKHMGPAPAQKLIPVRSEALQSGMYVAELDRSWLHSPFPATGFLITSAAQLEQLRRLCRHVYVDPARSEVSPAEAAGPATAQAPGPAGLSAAAGARQALDEVLRALADIVRGARRQGIVDLGSVARCAQLLVDQAAHDADALHWCLRVDGHGSFVYRRAAGTAAVATTLGLQIGLERDALVDVASGGLLLDLGKIAVPVPILAKPGSLDSTEQAYVRRHVERGLELVAGHDVPARALEMISAHHERIDGTGYPHQLSGTQIPLFGRIAAIADTFDAMTLDRRYAAAVSPHAALRQLDSLRDHKFDAALVTEMTHALGIYPVGTLVELADGQVALVCARRPRHPMQPQLLLTHDRLRQPLAEPLLAPAGDDTDIVRALPPRSVTVDAARLEPALLRLSDAAA